MKKTMIVIALFAILLVMAAAGSSHEYESREGALAPKFEVTDVNGDVVALPMMQGKYVLVNFWSSTDADSRINANLYDRFVKNNATEDKLSLVSVNMDRNESLFREIVRRDRLDAKSQVHVLGSAASTMMHSFGQKDESCRSYLIDPDGVIVAVNPGIDAVAAKLSI
ncbi:MAG: redoxin domain-containing protein [Paramuribaculum sp.]|nr:redoxin domain-containing protein [Paramuribaculum sp.]